ncbi:hypothetical protein [Streptomyces sp. GMR22]|uniref:hypothetical protein n=1 Tax=Streptomyces sp. GMR22 TaxID=2759524 RepID=UPI0015FB3885|nr:hypothetical protein [Streptomyces sp. GMR22]MBA6436553.1 hypothetical protein [Streptomyces sp. GMR22]
MSTAEAAITDVQSPGNATGARYDSAANRFTIWDNTYDDDRAATLYVTNVATGSSFTHNHGWIAQTSQSTSRAIPSTWKSGQEIRFFICDHSIYDGSGRRCSGTAVAWV